MHVISMLESQGRQRTTGTVLGYIHRQSLLSHVSLAGQDTLFNRETRIGDPESLLA